MRLAGSTLVQTSGEVGLSQPTVIAAVKAYRRGGWAAVAVKPRGRPAREQQHHAHPSVQLLGSLLNAARLEHSSANALWDLHKVQKWASQTHGITVSLSTIGNWLGQWQLQPQSRYRLLFNRATAETTAPVELVSAHGRPKSSRAGWKSDYESFIRRARRLGLTVLWVSSRTLAKEPNLSQLYAHNLRGAASWSLVESPAQTQDYLRFLKSLKASMSDGMALIIPSHHLLRKNRLRFWLSATPLMLPEPWQVHIPIPGLRIPNRRCL